ncbi:MAG TPA: prepilin peptidase [Candidatus Acidoferrales bacterium]|nr:prepilin peptidase [Candidatus Acidoferrales bacterium]
MPLLFVFFAFALGLVVGSFLNVCILRIPAGESIVFPASHCPTCGKPLAPYDNVPVLSWLVLRGKCRNCRAPISVMYPVVEFLSGALFALCTAVFGMTLEAGKWAVFSALLLILSVTDLRVRLLPNKVNLTGAVLGLASSGIVPVGDGTSLWISSRLFSFPAPPAALSVADALIGALVGAAILWVFMEGYFRLRGREGMGLGDVKMMGMMGTFLGTKAAVLTIVAGAVLGSVLGGIQILVLYLSGWKRSVAERAHRRKLGTLRDLRCELTQRYQLPFGLFLAAGGLLAVFYGPPLLAWYFSRFA